MERLQPISVPSWCSHQTGGERSRSESRFLPLTARHDQGAEGGGGGEDGLGGGMGGGMGEGDMGGMSSQMAGCLGLTHLLCGKMQRQ